MQPLSAQSEALLKDTITKTLGPEITVRWEIGEDVVIERGRKFCPIKGLAPDVVASHEEKPADYPYRDQPQYRGHGALLSPPGRCSEAAGAPGFQFLL
ncbi:MAG: hypothetical protein QM758_24700 [Armatimonas sp.]